MVTHLRRAADVQRRLRTEGFTPVEVLPFGHGGTITTYRPTA
jgi:hypothetical protein